jgi:hypothetical protein
MSKPDQNQGGVVPVSTNEGKTPLDRAKQIQELQDNGAAMPAAPMVPAQRAAGLPVVGNVAEAAPMKERFDVSPAAAPSVISSTPGNGQDQQAYGANQVGHDALYTIGNNDELQSTDPPWRIIPFGPPEQAAIFDSKKPMENYTVTVPPKAVVHKEGKLFQLTATPKTAGEPALKRAVLIDSKGGLKGAEFKTVNHLLRALTEIPSFARNVFRAIWPEADRDSPSAYRVKAVEVGKRSAYEVTVEQKNPVDGKWYPKSIPVNNFGLKVQPAAAHQLRKYDLVVSMYYLDRFQAA